MSAYSTSGIDGGIIGPMTDDTQVSAAAKAGGYLLSLVISVCISLPEAAASASAEPDMLASTMACRTFTCASPPRTRPTIALQNRNSRSMMLPVLMNEAARMNSGMASNNWLAIMPFSNCSAAVPMSRPDTKSQRMDPAIIAKATGSPMMLNPTMATSASNNGLVGFIGRSWYW